MEPGPSFDHGLDATALVESCAKRGLVCAVIAPRSDTDLAQIVAPATKRADVVVLDWRLSDGNGNKTLEILKKILEDDEGERLRLIAIYTGEQNLSEIGQTIGEELATVGRRFERCEHDVLLSYKHCQIVIYAKSHTTLPEALQGRSVSEEDLPMALIGDFASMTEGLLPNIALTSLAAIRESAHKILDRFDTELDAAFLAHRACLPFPDDAQQHTVDQLASELHAIMDDATVTNAPAGIEAIKDWLNYSLGENAEIDFGEGKKASFVDTVDLLSKGMKEKKPNCLQKNSGFRFLTAGFSKGGNAEHKLDSKLAWMINFRTVASAPAPILRLGTVVRKSDDANSSYFLCMRPRCDSLRLKKKSTFLFLPLMTNPKRGTVQLVIRTGKDQYQRVSVCVETEQWFLAAFSPNLQKGSVIAERENRVFYFTDENKMRFEWLGELKAEFAQRVAHRFASRFSRVAVINSEWLRREEDLSD